jgi:hypothetical protein
MLHDRTSELDVPARERPAKAATTEMENCILKPGIRNLGIRSDRQKIQRE